MTILIGGVSALFSYAGYVLAAPNLQEIVDGEVADPIPSILEDTLGVAGSKVFLIIAVMAFVSCVLSLQAAGSRLLYSSARDRMLPMSSWLAHMSPKHSVQTNALLVACVVPILICLYLYAEPDQLPRVTAFAVLGIYIAFQAVVLAALRQRVKGWRPAGNWNLGGAGMLVNVIALAYGIMAIYLLIKPGDTGSWIDDWVVAVGLFIVLATGLLYLFIAKPDLKSDDVAEGDAIEVANLLRSLREKSPNP
jgi:amino acid transporter